VSRPLRGALTAEMLAYVDHCLSPADRPAFERRMLECSEVRRQVEQWLRQNEAVRTAFAEPPRGAARAAGARLALRTSTGPRARPETGSEHDGSEAPRPPHGLQSTPERRRALSSPVPAAAGQAKAVRRRLPAVARRALGLIAVSTGLWIAGAAWPPPNLSTALADAGGAAYRTFADNRLHAVEVASNDRRAVRRWFASQLGRPAPVPDLAAAGLVLLGGRIVPGASAPAEFLLYEDARGRRIGVLAEDFDAPAASGITLNERGETQAASWTGEDYGFAVLGRAPAAEIAEIALQVRGEALGR
jgi:anti-sigma factor RsiW